MWLHRMLVRRVEAAFDQFYFGIPFTDARPNQITTIFMSNRDDYGSATLLQSFLAIKGRVHCFLVECAPCSVPRCGQRCYWAISGQPG